MTAGVSSHDVSPHSLAAERAVLGACLIDPEAYGHVSAKLEPQDFFRDAHRLLFTGLSTLARRGTPIDLLPLTHELERAGTLDRVGGAAYITQLTDGVPRSTNVEHYAEIVKTKARERWALQQLTMARAAIERGDLANARDQVRGFVDDTAGAIDDVLLEPIGQVAQRVATAPPRQLIRGLLAAVGRTLIAGDPRTMKSLATREIAVALAAGRAPFGLGRLEVAEALPVVYLTEEDSAAAVLEHLDVFSDGAATRGELPIYLSACRGITLDDPRVQDRIIRETALVGAAVVVIEPARSLTSCVDQGPRELQPFASFLRRFDRETQAAVVLGHHNVKPVVGHDSRKGAHRISGGGLFSVCEAPISFARLDHDRVLVTPTSWKHFATPAPFVIRLHTAGGRVRRLVGEEHSEPVDEPATRAPEEKVLAIVTDHPGLSSTEIAARCGGRKQAVIDTLYQLERGRKIRSEKEGRATCWYQRSGVPL
jgi:hypothetical protein